MTVVEAHGGGRSDVNKHLLLLVGEGGVLLGVAFGLAALLERTAVGVGAVLVEPLLDLVDGHADEELLEGVHLLVPGAGAHDVGVAAVALGDPALDLGGELLLGVGSDAIDDGVVVGVVVVAALAGPAAEVRHLGAVVVGRGVLQLIDVDLQYLAFAVKDDVCKDLVYTVDRRAGVILAGTHADGVAQPEALIRLGSFNGLGLSFLRVLLGGGAFAGRAGNGVLDCVYNAVAGVSCAGNDVNVGAVRGNDGGGDVLQGGAGGALAVGDDGDAGDGVAVHGDLDGYRPDKAVGRAGEGAAGRAGALKGVLDGVDDAVAGEGGAGHDIDIGAVCRDNGRRDLLKGVAGDAGGLAVGDDGDAGDGVAVHGDLNGDGAHEAVRRAGERAGSGRAVEHELAGGVDGADNGGGGDGGAGDGVDVAVHGEVALAVQHVDEEVPIALGFLAEAVGLVGVKDADAGDGAVVADGDEHVDVVGEAADDHLHHDALLTAVDAGDAAVGAGVFLLGVLAAAGDHVAEYLVQLGLLVGGGGAGKAGSGREEHQSGDEDDSDGDKELFHGVIHFPAPPFTTPKRLMGNALSNAQAQAFMMSMA